MDENKNWTNWQSFNPNVGFSFIARVNSGTSFNYQCTQKGLYLIFGSGYSFNITNITSTGTLKTILNVSEGKIYSVYAASAGKTITFNYVTGGYNGGFVLCYLGDDTRELTLVSHTMGGNTGSTYSKSISNVPNRILLATLSSGGTQTMSYTADVSRGFSSSDGRYYFICSTADMAGSANVSVRGTANNGTQSMLAELIFSGN